MTHPASEDGRRARCSQSGFSLIELLVALALLALLMMAIPSAIRLAARANAYSAALLEDRDGTAALGLIERTLAEVQPVMERDGEGQLRLSFAGGPDTLSFVAALADGPAGGGFYRFALRFAEESNGRLALRLSLTPYPPAPAASAGDNAEASPPERVLISGLQTGQFRYLGPAPGAQQPAWSDAWARTDRLPDMIEISLEPHPAAARRNPRSLRVELKLAAAR